MNDFKCSQAEERGRGGCTKHVVDAFCKECGLVQPKRLPGRRLPIRHASLTRMLRAAIRAIQFQKPVVLGTRWRKAVSSHRTRRELRSAPVAMAAAASSSTVTENSRNAPERLAISKLVLPARVRLRSTMMVFVCCCWSFDWVLDAVINLASTRRL